MKKTLIAIMTLAGVASAGTEFTDLSTNKTLSGITYTIPTTGSYLGAFTGTIAASGGGGVAHTGVAITLNLNSINKYFESDTATAVTLINFDNNHIDLGLALTKEGITATHAGTVWDDSRNFTISYAALNEASWVGADANTYVTITVCHSYASGANGGIMVYSDSKKLGGQNALGYTNNSTMNAIQINTDYVISSSITPGWTDSAPAIALASNLATSTKAVITSNVPEPATATLSLLVLCGLCARRRRK